MILALVLLPCKQSTFRLMITADVDVILTHFHLLYSTVSDVNCNGTTRLGEFGDISIISEEFVDESQNIERQIICVVIGVMPEYDDNITVTQS